MSIWQNLLEKTGNPTKQYPGLVIDASVAVKWFSEEAGSISAASLLTAISDVVGVLGGMVVTMGEAGVTASFYIDQILKTIIMDDFIQGVGKTIFFGFFIGIIACFQGLRTTGGTEGVGQSTTRSVVYCSLTIFVSDFFLTKLFLLLL